MRGRNHNRGRSSSTSLLTILVILALGFALRQAYSSMSGQGKQVVSLVTENEAVENGDSGENNEVSPDTTEGSQSEGAGTVIPNSQDFSYTPLEGSNHRTYSIPDLSIRQESSYALTPDNKRVDLTISGNQLSVVEGCEIHDASEITQNNHLVVGNASSVYTMQGTGFRKYYIYVPGYAALLETPLILGADDGSYYFTDFSENNKTFTVTTKMLISDDRDYFKSQADQICQGCTTEREKVKAVHDYLCENFAYDLDMVNDHTLYVRDDKASFEQRRGICENFARWTCDLLNAEGIECVMATGIGVQQDSSLTEKPDHAWNIVQIDGAWYPMDVTWDCRNSYSAGTTTTGQMRTTYFLDPHAINGDHIMIQQ